jgi:hypothetical protein
LTEYQDKCLTADVLAFQKNRSDATLHESVHHATQKLLYSLPSALHILPEEDCCEFLFYCYDTIDHYIDSYREGNLSYPGYIAQVVRKRSRYFVTLRRSRQMREQVLVDYEKQCREHELLAVAEEVPNYPAYGEIGRFTKLNTVPMDLMPALFRSLVDGPKVPSDDGNLLSEAQSRLRERLKTKANRRRFVIMLAISPHLMERHLLFELASVLEVDPDLLDRYLATAQHALEKKRQTKGKFEETSRRHFRRLLEIQSALQATCDEQERERLEKLQQWTERAFEAKVRKIRGMEFHLSHSQIAGMLGIPKGTVASSMHYMKILLQECLDER